VIRRNHCTKLKRFEVASGLVPIDGAGRAGLCFTASLAEAGMETGVVKWFNNDKGYGFIKRSTGEDVFVHHSSIQATGYRTLNEGERVEFDVKQGPKGLQAENVRRAEGGRAEEAV
jgi:CspA family cold shock protein